jgi:cobalt-zinc-cadmium efflux system outer membrane protein
MLVAVLGLSGLLLGTFAAPVAAETRLMARAESLAFSALPAKVSARNKHVASARALIEQARARKMGVTLSNPELTYELSVLRSGGAEHMVALMQAFPLAGRLARQRELAHVDILKAALEVERRVEELSAGLAQVYAQLLINEAKADRLDNLLEHLRGLEAELRLRIEQGQAAPEELDSFLLELAALEMEIFALEDEEQNLRLELNSQLFVEDYTRLVTVDSLERVLRFLKHATSQSETGLEARRSDLKALALDIDRAEKERALARAARWGDVSVSIFATSDFEVDDGDTFGFSITVPLPFWNFGRAARHEAEASRTAALEDYDGQLLRARNEVAAMARLSRRAADKCRLYDERVLPVVERGYQAALTSFESGGLDAQGLFNASRTRLLKLNESSDCQGELINALLKQKRALGVL